MARLGFGAIRPPAGVAVVSALLGALSSPRSYPPQLLASVFYWDRLRVSSAFFDALAQHPSSAAAEAQGGVPAAPIASSGAAATLASAALTREALASAVSAAVVSVLGMDVGPDVPLVGAGLDSLGEEAAGRASCALPFAR